MKNIQIFVFIFLSTTLCAQQKHNLQPSIEGFQYIEHSKGPNNGNLPLLIAFHYSSGNPLETIADYDSLKKPVRIILPKGNYNKRNGYSYFPLDYYQKDSISQQSISKTTVDSIAKFVKAVEKKYKPKAIVSGISQGGDIAFLLAIYYPELCKASLPFAAVIQPFVSEQLKNKPIKKIPIYLFQGEADKIVSVYTTQKRVKEIGRMLKIKLKTYTDLGHDISPQMKIDYSKIIDKLN